MLREEDKRNLRRFGNFRGNLRDCRLAGIIIGIEESAKTGVLEINTGKTAKRIYVSKGEIVFADSENADDRLEAYLFKKGEITLAELEKFSSLLIKTGQKMVSILVEQCCLTPKELSREVRYHILDIILSLFSLEEGEFQFKERPIPEDKTITLKTSTSDIIYHGIKRINSFVFLKKICPSSNDILKHVHNSAQILQSLEIEKVDKKILSYVNGEYPLKTILFLSPFSDFETLKTLSAFISAGLVYTVKENDDYPPPAADKMLIYFESEDDRAEASDDIEPERAGVSDNGALLHEKEVLNKEAVDAQGTEAPEERPEEEKERIFIPLDSKESEATETGGTEEPSVSCNNTGTAAEKKEDTATDNPEEGHAVDLSVVIEEAYSTETEPAIVEPEGMKEQEAATALDKVEEAKEEKERETVRAIVGQPSPTGTFPGRHKWIYATLALIAVIIIGTVVPFLVNGTKKHSIGVENADSREVSMPAFRDEAFEQASAQRPGRAVDIISFRDESFRKFLDE
jgi:hypothetical protein